jgi:hypothetical protein
MNTPEEKETASIATMMMALARKYVLEGGTIERTDPSEPVVVDYDAKRRRYIWYLTGKRVSTDVALDVLHKDLQR